MAELMFRQDQTKAIKATQHKVRQTRKDVWKYEGRPDEDVEAVHRKTHFTRDQGMKETARATVKDNANVMITETVESSVRADQFARDQNDKSTRTQTKEKLKNVVITDTVEGESRKEHFVRDQGWKQEGREQIQKNTNFDLARALFA